jgi:hypothetical protein
LKREGLPGIEVLEADMVVDIADQEVADLGSVFVIDTDLVCLDYPLYRWGTSRLDNGIFRTDRRSRGCSLDTNLPLCYTHPRSSNR